MAKVVFPGEVITEIKSIKGLTVIGPGLKRHESQINSLLVTKPGRLNFQAPNTYWIDHHYQKRYIPKRGDLVVGIITKKSGDTLKIDIGSSEAASLSMLAFEGATKKQKPDVQVGDVVYGKLLNAHKEMEPELVCIDSYFRAGRMGPLSNEGFLVTVSTGLVTRLLDPTNPLLTTLGKKMPYEIAIGMNGKVWINAKSADQVLSLVQSLEAAEVHDDKAIAELCRQFK